jgi:glycosyltransferase involved in cell wall biosynthesis
MKKLIICIPSLRLGGAAKIALNLTEYYLGQGIEVYILLTDPHSEDSGFSNMPTGVKIHSLPKVNLHHFLLPFVKVFQLKSLFKELKPDGILAVRHDATSIASLAWKLNGRQGNFVIRDINPITKTLNRNTVMVRLIKMAYQSADAVIANSRDVADALIGKNWLSKDKIHVIDNPVISDSFFKRANEPVTDPWVSQTSVPLIITIGRLDKMKDQQTLIRAFSLVCKTRKCRLMLIGDGPEAANLQKLVNSLDLQEQVKLAGPLENPYPILKRAEIFVLSSKYEGFGNVLVEALALGKKIISSDCPGGPGYILDHGRFGTLFPVGDHQKLAAEILRSLESNIDRMSLIKQSERFRDGVIAQSYGKLLFKSTKPVY